MGGDDIYTNDGTVNIHKKPAIKTETGNWKACSFILGTECCERLAHYGMSTNLVNYLTDRLNQGNVTASNNVTNWGGTCYITSLIGAFLADAYLGRYWTIASFSIVYVIEKKSSFFNWFYFSINVGALIASSVLVWIQMNVGWGWGLGIPTVSMAIAVAFFFSGSQLYRLQKPGWSPLTRIAQVIIASMRKYSLKVPADKDLYEIADKESNIEGSRKLEHTEKFKCLDVAAMQTDADHVKGSVNPWRLCTVTQVEELKSIIRLLPVWASGIVFTTVYSQMSTMFVLQGNTMDQRIGPHFKIPSASLSLFDTLSVLFWAPVYDRFIIPLARKYTGNERGFSQLRRMGIGLVLSIVAMLVARTLEVIRLNHVRSHNYYDLKTIPITIFWQVPRYFLVGCAEVFTFIRQLEFYHDQAPDAMRSLCSALSLTTITLGNYLSTLLVTIVTAVTTRHGKLGWIPENLNRGHLDYFYWLLAILIFINFLVYLWNAKWYKYKKASEESH